MEFLFVLLVSIFFGSFVIFLTIFFTHLASRNGDPLDATLKTLNPILRPFTSLLSAGVRPVAKISQSRAASNDLRSRIDKYDALQRLQDLRDKGTISPQEFETEKQAILSRKS